MKNKNEQSTASSLLRFAGPYKGRYVLSICLSVLGVASGLVPYYAAAKILIGLIGTERNFSFYIFGESLLSLAIWQSPLLLFFRPVFLIQPLSLRFGIYGNKS